MRISDFSKNRPEPLPNLFENRSKIACKAFKRNSWVVSSHFCTAACLQKITCNTHDGYHVEPKDGPWQVMACGHGVQSTRFSADCFQRGPFSALLSLRRRAAKAAFNGVPAPSCHTAFFFTGLSAQGFLLYHGTVFPPSPPTIRKSLTVNQKYKYCAIGFIFVFPSFRRGI